MIFGEEDQQMTFKDFMKDYFLGERKIKVKVFNTVIPTPPFEVPKIVYIENAALCRYLKIAITVY